MSSADEMTRLFEAAMKDKVKDLAPEAANIAVLAFKAGYETAVVMQTQDPNSPGTELMRAMLKTASMLLKISTEEIKSLREEIVLLNQFPVDARDGRRER